MPFPHPDTRAFHDSPACHPERRRARGLAVLLWITLLAMLALGAPAEARRGDAAPDLGTVRVGELPPEGRATLAAIRAGGPFASRRDGMTFGNRERLLPIRPRGYYVEFTVRTPGDRTRGARRIIAGRGGTGDVRDSGEYYYTDDHYQSFRRILQ